MPFDGFVTKCVAEELNILLAGGRIEKVTQPERDEVHIVVRNIGANHRLLISANAATPRIHLTRGTKGSPPSAPMFCMILRKYLVGGRVTGVSAAGFERVVAVAVESANELGDVSQKTLYAEIMGKHSNIILVNHEGRVIDALVHVDRDMSSVREVMPARPYTPPPPQNKLVPGEASVADVCARVAAGRAEFPMKKLTDALLDAVMGASPLFCRELCHRAALGAQTPLALVSDADMAALGSTLAAFFENVFSEKYAPCILLREQGTAGESFADFYCYRIRSAGMDIRAFDTVSEAADAYFSGRADAASLKQRKASLVKLVNNNLARCKKKLALQEESMREAADRGALKLRGELIIANIHAIPAAAASVRLHNYYAAAEPDGGADAYIDVELDGELSPQANAQRYFKKYRKAESTWKNAEAQSGESRRELIYLESVLQELEMSVNQQEIDEIRTELAAQKYVADARVGKNGKRPAARQPQSQPRAFLSSDGLDILVGRNNRQNDQLTLKTASSNDIWLHARNLPGSHVLIKKRQGDVPERTLAEAAVLAAYFSKARMSENVSVDYTAARHVRKPSGAKPGMVIYDNQRTLTATPDEALIALLTPAPVTILTSAYISDNSAT